MLVCPVFNVASLFTVPSDSPPNMLLFCNGPVWFYYFSLSTNQRFHTHPTPWPALLPVVTLLDSPPSGPHWTRPAPLTVLTRHRTLSRPPPPGLIGLHLQVSTPHCNTFSPPTILVLLPSTPSLLCYRASRSVTLLVFSMFKHFSFLKFLQLLFMFPVSIHVLVWVHIFCE